MYKANRTTAVFVYTDESYINQAGSGVTVKYLDQEKDCLSTLIGVEATNYDSELIQIAQAPEMILSMFRARWKLYFHIFTYVDSVSAMTCFLRSYSGTSQY